MRIAVATTIGIMLPAIAAAHFILGPNVYDMTRGADVIVEGELHDVHCEQPGDVETWHGALDVTDVIWGDVDVGDCLLLRWTERPQWGGSTLREWHRSITERDEEPLWHGRLDESGCVHIASPMWVQRGRDRVIVEYSLDINPLRADIVRVLAPEVQGVYAVLGYRNASDEERTFPGMEFRDGQLRFASSEASLLVYVSPKRSTPPLELMPWAVAVDPELPPVRVPAHSEWCIVVDLEEVCGARLSSIEHIRLSFGVVGLGLPHKTDWIEPREALSSNWRLQLPGWLCTPAAEHPPRQAGARS